MAAVDDTASALDYLVLRWKKGDATERAKLLKWLQDGEDNLWNAADWWFACAETTITFTISVATVDTATSIARVIHLLDASGNALDHIPYGTFVALYRSSAATGVPQVWTTDKRAADGKITIRLWPIPSATTTGTIMRKIQQSNLTDSGGSVSAVPREYRNATLYYAQWLMALDEGQQAEAGEWYGRYDKLLLEMKEENKRQRGELPI